MDELSPKRLNVDIRGGGVMFEDGPCKHVYECLEKIANSCIEDSDYVLLPPKRKLEIDSHLHKKLTAALITRYSPDDPRMKISVATASKHVPTSVHQWGQAQIHDGGDRFKCRALLKGQRHTCDCTFVKVSWSQPFLYWIPMTNCVTTSIKLRSIFMNAK